MSSRAAGIHRNCRGRRKGEANDDVAREPVPEAYGYEAKWLCCVLRQPFSTRLAGVIGRNDIIASHAVMQFFGRVYKVAHPRI